MNSHTPYLRGKERLHCHGDPYFWNTHFSSCFMVFFHVKPLFAKSNTATFARASAISGVLARLAHLLVREPSNQCSSIDECIASALVSCFDDAVQQQFHVPTSDATRSSASTSFVSTTRPVTPVHATPTTTVRTCSSVDRWCSISIR